MPKAIRYTLLSLRDLLVSAGPVAALAIALLVLAYLWLDPDAAQARDAGDRAGAKRL